MSGADAAVRDGVAVIDDEPLVLRAVQRILAPCGHAVVLHTSLDALGGAISDPCLSVVLLDLFMGGASEGAIPGLQGLERVRRDRPDVEVVVMTGRASIESAVSCMRAGAFDYLCKPFADIERVRDAVQAARSLATGDRRDGASTQPTRVGVRDLASDWLRVPLIAPPGNESEVPLSLEAYERLALERALREASGDAAEAARRLGIGRSTFYRRAGKLGVDLRTGDGELASGAASEPALLPRRVGGGPPIR